MLATGRQGGRANAAAAERRGERGEVRRRGENRFQSSDLREEEKNRGKRAAIVAYGQFTSVVDGLVRLTLCRAACLTNV